MITIVGVNKQGNKILNYDCTDGSKSLKLTKDEVAELIKKKEVTNARMQIYKNNVIIRVKDVVNKVATKVAPVAKKDEHKIEAKKEVETPQTTLEKLFVEFDDISDLFKDENLG